MHLQHHRHPRILIAKVVYLVQPYTFVCFLMFDYQFVVHYKLATYTVMIFYTYSVIVTDHSIYIISYTKLLELFDKDLNNIHWVKSEISALGKL